MTTLSGPFIAGAGSDKLEPAVAKQWFADHGDATLRLDYPLTPDSLVLDVGGYEGNWAAQIRQRHHCRIHIFEPVPQFAENIRVRFAADSAVTVHAVGMSDTTAATEITLSADGTSVHRSKGEKVPIRLQRADQLFADLDLRHVALMKINIEGCEYELLEHLVATGLVARIDNIQVQFHDFVPGAAARMASVQRLLQATHEMTWHYRFVWENWKRKALP